MRTRSMPSAMPNELTREQFIAHLVKAGWRKDEAESEWDAIQNDEESGYDGDPLTSKERRSVLGWNHEARSRAL